MMINMETFFFPSCLGQWYFLVTEMKTQLASILGIYYTFLPYSLVLVSMIVISMEYELKLLSQLNF